MTRSMIGVLAVALSAAAAPSTAWEVAAYSPSAGISGMYCTVLPPVRSDSISR